MSNKNNIYVGMPGFRLKFQLLISGGKLVSYSILLILQRVKIFSSHKFTRLIVIGLL